MTATTFGKEELLTGFTAGVTAFGTGFIVGEPTFAGTVAIATFFVFSVGAFVVKFFKK